MDSSYIIDIVPLTRLPLGRQQYFSYLSSQKIPVGSLVSAPLFRRNLNGIVIKSRSDFVRMGNIRLKYISKIIEESFLTEKQIELARFISDYYFCSLGIVFKFFVPKTTKIRSKKQKTENENIENIKLSEEQEKIAKIITQKNTKYLLTGPASCGKTETVIQTIKKLKTQEKNCQFLILLPEILAVTQIIERFKKHFKAEEIAVLHSKISKGEFYSYWQKIKSGEIKIIIGTRIAVLAPFKNLRLIAIEDEQDVSFKQWDMNPRYDARTVAEKLAELQRCPLIRISSTPGIKSYYEALNGKYELLKLPPLIKSSFLGAVIVDMRKERWAKNYSPLSEKLKSEIKYALKNKLQTILFVNRQGMSSFSICASCRSILKCPRCERALIYQNKGNYCCLHCAYKTGILATCPKCGGTIFKNLGMGTQRIEKEIKKEFPKAVVETIDFEGAKKLRNISRIQKNFTVGQIDILIGTQMAIKQWDLPNVGLVGIISADSLLDIPDFSSGESAFQKIVQAMGRTGRFASRYSGKSIIQTYNPDNFIIKSAAEADYEKLYQNEIENRKTLSYPPFSRVIKLTFQSPDEKKAENEAKRIYQLLKTLALKKIRISPVGNPLVSKSRKRFRKQIVIKISSEHVIENKLKKTLQNIPSYWIIDIDPISIV